ncbi:Cerato-platanin-domain-containing protein [Russula emetica]|nr:Cerato-platanin-domain-containing protein [Russula emetica]
MIFSITFALALLLTHVAHALPHAEHNNTRRSTTLLATFDTTYDNPSGSLNDVACSNGANGLAATFPTFGDIPTFPYIGGAPGIVWNSPNCGGCWQLVSATGASIFMTAIDSSSTFNIAQEAFEALNGGQVGQGTLVVFAEQVPPYLCGL